MNETRCDSASFESLSRELMQSGHSIRFQARGRSMIPLIADGELLQFDAVDVGKLRVGEIIMVKTSRGIRAHRLISIDREKNQYVTKGDSGQESDAPVAGSQILGRVILNRREVFARRIRHAAQRFMNAYILQRTLGSLFAVAIFLIALVVASQAQVVLNDATTNGRARPNNAGNFNLTFTHTTAANANRLLVVGVSLNVVSNPNAAVSGVTYNGAALTRLGFHLDAGITRRSEIWYRVAPATGTNLNVVVTVNLPLAARVGITAGAMTFRGVDQTVPLSTVVSNDGAADTLSQLDIPSGPNQIVFDVLSVSAATVTPGPSQTQQWNPGTTGAAAQDVVGFGSTNVGAASVPMSETFSAASNWSVVGASVRPMQADVAVTIIPAGAVGPPPQTVSYTISVTNNGPTSATNVTLSDTIAAGLTGVVSTPSQGTCTGSGPVTCNLGTIAGGATVTVTVTANASATGSYPNTAFVTATQPDFNSGNNSYTAIAVVQNITCAVPGILGDGGTLTGVVNTYYPATASVAAGVANTSIPLGTPRGAAATLQAGDLLLVMQMQDAGINSTNSIAYGNGSTGAGFTVINGAGLYEFVKATGPVSGGAVPVTGAGLNGGLVNTYTIAPPTATKGQSTYQVIRIPQYATATLSSGLTAAAWDGTSGGVVALDIAGALTLGSATVSVDGLGFRGGAGLQLSGGAGSNADYVHTSPATYAGASIAGVDASKGESVAGTPLWVQSGGTFLSTGTDGYPGGGTARGAPANGGGGGTDGNPAANDQNAGGGGGSNGGIGGTGGNSWNSTLSIGGLGGNTFPASPDRISLGGGGGAGTRNNSDGDNQASAGASGGGIIFIRAGSLTGTATLTANGGSAYNGTVNDAGGGGGGGGTVVVLSAGGGEGGLVVRARGGSGGNAWQTQAFTLDLRHGPGGGGGGGVVYLTGAASTDVSGGLNGTTLNAPAVAYGATSGAAGFTVNSLVYTQGAGTQAGASCIPDLTIAKSHSPASLIRGNPAVYGIAVNNVGTAGPTTTLVTVNDSLPLGMVPTSAGGVGWSCAVAQQTVSCTRADALPAVSAYPTISINANVSQTAPNTVVNTAIVSGGGEINLANDIATDVATVGSSSDLAVSNAGAPNPVVAGSNITYTQIVTNNGPSDATSVTLVEAVPANTTLVSVAAPAGWNCSNPVATGTITCVNSDFPVGTSSTFVVVVAVNAGTANGTLISDTITASSSVSDSVPANNSATSVIVVGPNIGGQADLSVVNVASPNPVAQGGVITYAQAVTNSGGSAATTATFSETIPTNTTFLSFAPPAGWTCTTPAVGGTGTVSCTNPSVAGGSVGNFQLRVTVGAAVAGGTVITDTVAVGAVNDATAGNNAATAIDIVATSAQSDLALSTSTNPSGQVLAGNNLIYTQTIANNGPAASNAITFTEATPANTTFQSILAPGWTCTTPAVGASGTVTCTIASLAAGTVSNIAITVNVNANTANATNISATSSVSGTTSDPNAANNTTTVTTQSLSWADLTVTNSGTPSPVLAGNNITYTQTVTNKGPSNAATLTFTEAIPANSTFVSAAPPAGWSCTLPTVGGTGTITCTSTTLAVNATANFQVVVRVNSGVPSGTIISDTATFVSASHDSNLLDNSATVNIAVGAAGQADLNVSNAGTPDPVTAGNNITYTQVASNSGPAAAATVTFTEAIPANTTFVSLPTPAGWTCTTPAVGATGTITCTIASLASAANATFVVTVKVNTNTAFGTLVTDTDSISAATTDPNAGNNSATSTIAVGTTADLSVTNSDTPDPVQAGNNITYAQVVTNPGPSNAANVTFTEAIPANTNFRSFTPPAGWTCNTLVVGGTGTLTCTIASLAPGSTNFSVAVQVNAGTAAGTTITDTVSVVSPTDTNPANNTASIATTVASAGQADLVMTNSPSVTNVNAGGAITYTQTVTNNGPATATTLTFTETIPANTTFQSITPGLWICPAISVGFTGTFSCTLTTLNAAASAPISIAVLVDVSTPSGTVISDTASVAAATSDPNAGNSTATALVTVGTGTSADVAITKTAAPTTVNQGNLLTYTLTVTNNGPASATNVTAVDSLPGVLTFVSVTTTAGTCSQASNTVTCQLGTMASAATATIKIVVTPQTNTIVTNSAFVTADQNDPNSSNNSSSITTLVNAPTRIHLQTLTAEASTHGIVVRWKTGGEVDNLGFNVYREENGSRQRLNPTLIAGSALLMRGNLDQHGGKSYVWIDPAGTPSTLYWLEDVDLHGERGWHGPFSPNVTASSARVMASRTLAEAAPSAPGRSSQSHELEARFRPPVLTKALIQRQFGLAAQPAVKIMVDHEGWYRVNQASLVAAGLDPQADPRNLRLFAEGVEQAMLVSGARTGRGGFGPKAAIEFYGTGLDTPFSGTRVYWLIADSQSGLRVPRLDQVPGDFGYVDQFNDTVELRQRTTYFAALLNAKDENFFGALVSSTPVDQVIETPYVNPAANLPRIEVVLQGVGEGVPHDVLVALNGATLGNITFSGQTKGRLRLQMPSGVLLDGANTVTLTAQDGDSDVSLVDSIRVTYSRGYVAGTGRLKFTSRAGAPVAVKNFSVNGIRIFDITNPVQPTELAARVVSGGDGTYTAQVQVPFAPSGRHTLLALSRDQIASPLQLVPNQPSNWHSPQTGGDVVFVSNFAFADAIAPLTQLRQQQGHGVSLVLTDDIYDEFSFGEHNPQAIRDFLQTAASSWKTKPKYLLLAGDASVDPRNFLGMGDFDFVPTRIIPTPHLMTASDDWFSDFSDTGMPTLATGRIAVRTVSDAQAVVSKIVGYENSAGDWTKQVLLVADRNDSNNFTHDAESVAKQLPSWTQVTDIFATNLDPGVARAQLLSALNSGQLLVNYIGHGSVEEMSGDALLDNENAAALTNAPRLPVVISVDCLNGFFHDVYTQSLAETLMLNPQGGAVAVIASSGLTNAQPQLSLDRSLVPELFQNNVTVGDALLHAKASVRSDDVRRTYILFGDPLMKLKWPMHR